MIKINLCVQLVYKSIAVVLRVGRNQMSFLFCQNAWNSLIYFIIIMEWALQLTHYRTFSKSSRKLSGEVIVLEIKTWTAVFNLHLSLFILVLRKRMVFITTTMVHFHHLIFRKCAFWKSLLRSVLIMWPNSRNWMRNSNLCTDTETENYNEYQGNLD